MTAIVALAAIHYLALALGFAGIVTRLLALKDLRGKSGSLQRVFLGDNLWGIAALLWLVTGLMRAFGDYGMGSNYYLSNRWFLLKMALFGAVFLLELYPMITLVKWRMGRWKEVSMQQALIIERLYKISAVQTGLILLLPLLASMMAKGVN